MKRCCLSLMSLFFTCLLFSQQSEGYQFTTIKENPITSIKNQASSGTCWCFSGLALIESELLRMNKGTYDLSEMYIVHGNYQEKAKKYVRMHGSNTFSGGGTFADVIDGIRDFGIVPETAMSGLNYGESQHKHGELDQFAESYVKAAVSNPNKTLSTAWFEGFRGILDAYLGKCPVTFTYEGNEYTPQAFANAIGIVPSDYVSITSFTHHPFYSAFPIEVPDNWRWASAYNLPVDEMMDVIRQAVERGYCVAWASDVSEKGFSRKGIAIVPDMETSESPGSDQAHWLELTQKEKEDLIASLKMPVPEQKITQEIRQQAFDNYGTTDDHGLLIYGTAKDQNGTNYFLVKNSWGGDGPYKGSLYASETFVKFKTTNIVVHKNVLSIELKMKLNLK